MQTSGASHHRLNVALQFPIWCSLQRPLLNQPYVRLNLSHMLLFHRWLRHQPLLCMLGGHCKKRVRCTPLCQNFNQNWTTITFKGKGQKLTRTLRKVESSQESGKSVKKVESQSGKWKLYIFSHTPPKLIA